jgi:hypothetical protein
MRALLALAVIALAGPAFAAPWCHAPRGGNAIILEIEIGKFTETEKAQFYQMRLRQLGIDARNTTLWNGCVQSIVRENGRIVMRFYDPWTLEEIPVD